MDNRLGAYVALESLRRCHERGGPGEGSFAAVAAVQEEIGLFGARTAAFEVRPDLAVAVDVTHATDAPGVDEKEIGSHPLGSGPAIGRGSTLSPKVFELLVETAEEAGIEHTISASGRGTSTDADVIQISRSGIPTGLVSIPLRYMHSPVEMVDLRDVEATVELIAAFAGAAQGRRRPQPLTTRRQLRSTPCRGRRPWPRREPRRRGRRGRRCRPVPGSETATPMLIVTAHPDRAALAHLPPQPLGDLDRVGAGGAGQDDEDLLAADPVDRVAGAQRGPHRVGDVLQDGVAGGVAELVVDPLEVVEVAEQQRVREALLRVCRAGRRARRGAARARCG